MLFNFNLTPLDKVSSWGEPDDRSLHWFGLTDGEYWIQAGDAVLFEYSEAARTKGMPRYVDYFVVRLYEDLLEMLPYILEPVPYRLTQYFTGETASDWLNTSRNWCVKHYDGTDEDFDKIFRAAIIRTDKAWLDNDFLTPSANISIWSDTNWVHIEWNNKDRLYEGHPAWSANSGSFQMSRPRFVEEVQSFHSRLMEQMSARVEQVLSGALSAGIKIDLPGLKREHRQRGQSLEHAMQATTGTDWSQTEWAIREVLKG